MILFYQLTYTVALTALWQIYCAGWSSKMTSVLEAKGARKRWFEQLGNEIALLLEILDAATW